jgi:hypothetical protein
VTHLSLAPQSGITAARLQVSLDNGRTWHPAKVRKLGAPRFLAVFTAPAGQAVTLRLAARDATGATVTETILAAYRTSG